MLGTNDELANWDAIAVFTNKDICGSTAGCRNGKSIWIEVDEHGDPPFQFEFAIKDSVFSHELGHIFGFDDQYCSQAAWTGSSLPDKRCSPASPTALNPLSAALGCDPAQNSDCCDECTEYEVCCDGNLAADGNGGRSIMSGAGNVDYFPKGWDSSELAYLQDFSNGRTPTNTAGKVVMDCAYAFQGAIPVVTASFTVEPRTGAFSISDLWTGVGRPGFEGQNRDANFCLIMQKGTAMLGEFLCQRGRRIHWTAVRRGRPLSD